MKTTAIGVALYRIKLNGCLVGRWSVASDKSVPPGTSKGVLGTEMAKPLKRNHKTLEGLYDVEIVFEGKKVFQGILDIRKIQKNSYQLSWIKDGISMYTGYGVRRKRSLAANYWAVQN